MDREIIDKMLQQAAAWVGYCEKGSRDYKSYESKTAGAGRMNWTRFGRLADIVIFGADKRVKDGYSWCCMFILAVLYELMAGRQDCTAAAGSMPVNVEARAWVRSVAAFGAPLTYFAGCQAWLNAYRSKGRVEASPAPGDFVVYLTGAGMPYHIGIVEAVNGDGSFATIEGNTSAEGDEVVPNGGVVARKKRKKNKNCVFLKNNFLYLQKV